jgi:succinate-semialdehyde dehydrogenase/glutarate-semialdehyde dehydrogenase
VVRFAVPALIAGNSVIVKHSSLVPRCADAIHDLFGAAGYGEQFTAASLPHSAVPQLIERVNAVVVTAGEETGRDIAALAGRHLKKVILELGGSDAFIVMPSADLDRAVATAVRSRLHCNGQACTAAKRFILHEEIATAFEERFVAAMESVRCGDPFDEETELGPLATADVAAKLDRQVAMTIMSGAEVLAGGYRIKGNLYAPTVLAEVPIDSPAAQEETFGPVAALFRVRSMSEAIELANNSRYGLDATVWTRDAEERERFIEALRVAQVFINTIASSHPALPFGGTKDSGYGRELGVAGVRELTLTKSVSY